MSGARALAVSRYRGGGHGRGASGGGVTVGDKRTADGRRERPARYGNAASAAAARRITANNTENELLFRGSGRATRRLVKMDAPRTDIASRHRSQAARQAQHHAASVPGLRLHDERTAILPRRHLSCSTERLSQRADELYISRVLLDCYLPIKLMEFVYSLYRSLRLAEHLKPVLFCQLQ